MAVLTTRFQTRLMVQDGYDCSTSTPIDDYWILTNANGMGGTPTWVEVNTGSNRPGPRYGQTAAYDPTSNELIIFGGTNGQRFGSFDDVWVLSNANGIGGSPAWTQLSTLGQAPGGAYWSTTYDPVSNTMTVVYRRPSGTSATQTELGEFRPGRRYTDFPSSRAAAAKRRQSTMLRETS